MSRRQKGLEILVNNAALLMCFLLVIYNALFSRNFLNLNTAWNILAQTVAQMFVTMGMTIVLSCGCTDLSASSLMAISSSVTGCLVIAGEDQYIAILLGVGIGAACGALNGTIVAGFNLQPMVAMLIMRMIYRAAANIYTNGLSLQVKCEVATLLGRGRVLPVRMPIIIIPMIAGILIAFFIVKSTKLGKRLEAVGNNQKTAYLCGINVKRTIIIAYICSSIFAAVGGILYMFRSSAIDSNTIGIDYEMTAIAASIIGGTSMRGGKAHVLGAVFGTLLMTLITMTVNYSNIQYEWANVFKALVIILAIALQNAKRI